MKLIFFFLATSSLLTAAAIPMMVSFGSSSAPSVPPDRNQAPKVDFGSRMSKLDRAAAKDLMIDHYNGPEPGSDQKRAKLAFAQNGWIDGTGHDDQHRQYLNFNYHQGDTPNSARIGQTVTVARDRPLPESHFSHEVLNESKPEIINEMNKEYKALPPDVAKHVRSMKAHNDWAHGPGLREQSQITFHRGATPSVKNTIGNPVTVYRPMSFLIDGPVPKDHIPTIKKRIREEHEKLDGDHPLKQANFGVVTDGWQKGEGKKNRSKQVGATLYKVKDQLSDSAETDFERVGDFHVTLGKGRSSRSKSLTMSTRRRLQAGTIVPDMSTSNLEAPSPYLS